MFKWMAIVAVAAFTFMPAARTYAFDWSDNTIGYWYGWQFKEPGFAKDAVQHNLEFTHADGYKYGSNFFDFNFTKWGDSVPANNSTTGASEFYGVYRTVLSGNKVTGSTHFSFGPVKDVGLEAGGDLDSENSAFATGKYLVVVGPQFAIAVPKGFWNIGLLYGHEWDNNGIAERAVNFDPQVILETAWSFPFSVGPVPLQFAGYMNIRSPKGRDGFGNQTRTELVAHPKLLVDVGDLVYGIANKVDAGVGFEYWKNKFGSSPSATVGTEQRAVFFEADYHL